MADPLAIADKIADKAVELLSPLEVEMNRNKWPNEFRVIMWDAVASMASKLAEDAKNSR